MNDDQLIERLKRTLESEASTVTSPPDAWPRYSAGGVASFRPARDPRVWLGVPAGVIGIAAAIALAVLAVRSPSPARSSSVSAGAAAALGASGSSAGGGAGGVGAGAGTAAAGAPTASTRAFSGPAGGPVPAGFTPQSVTFVSPSLGWVLGNAPCSAPTCTSVLRTTDGGATWKGIPAPRAALATGNGGVSQIRFVNSRDGWVFGPELWSTHDGGATWRAVPLPAYAEVWDVEASEGVVHAAVFDAGQVRMFDSVVSADAFAPVPASVSVGAGPVPTAQIVLQGNAGWMIEVDRTVVGGLQIVGGAWKAWGPPCADALGPAVVAAASPTSLWAACDVGVWGGTPRGELLYASSDGGTSFAEVGPIPLQSVNQVAAIGTITIAAGTTSTSDAIVRSVDGGRTWSTAYSGTGREGWGDVGFTTATQGVAVERTGAVLMTHDGGATWERITFGP